MSFSTLQPLLWLLVVPAMGAGLWISLVDRPGPLKFSSFALRALALALLALALCRPFVTDQSEDLHTAFLVDVSESADLDDTLAATGEIADAIGRLGPGDSWSLHAVADGMRRFDSPEDLEELLRQWSEGVADDQFRSASRIADALLDTRLGFPAGKARRIVLCADGQDTSPDPDGEIAEALRILGEEGLDLRFRRSQGLDRAEAAVTAIDPSTPLAHENEMVRFRVTAAANRSMPARVRILHKGVAVAEQTTELRPRPDNRIDFDLAMTTPGPSVWAAELLPEEDFFPINNQLSTTVTVRGKPRLLVLHREPRDMRPLARALREQDFDVEIRGNHGLPESMDRLLAFDAVVLADVPATDLATRQMTLLQRYVADFGGGLAMLGSDNSFGLGGYFKTPVEEVLPLTSRYEKEKEKPSLAMVLVIDKSGSMQGAPIQLARMAAQSTAELLSARDQIAVIGFDGQPQVVCEMRSAGDRASIEAAIGSLAAGGGTDVYPAMAVAREMLETAPAKLKHMLILSDGQTQPADHIGLTQSMADAGVTVSTVALGDGAARELMAAIAETGGGRYYETTDPTSVPQIFTKETMQASKSAIKEDLFGAVQSGDHPILAGYEQAELPFVLGYVMTKVKPTAQSLLVTETGDPLLAVSRFGLGMGAAYTSDLTENWGGEWLAWDSGGKFWAQVFRGIARKSDTEGLAVSTTRSATGWTLGLRRRDPDGSPVSRIEWDAAALDDDGRTTPLTVRETGLGRYRAEIPLSPGTGRLSIRLHDRSNDKLETIHLAAGYPAEYRLSSDLPPALAEAPAFVPAAIREAIQPAARHRSVAHHFVFASLACLLGGILLRRV